MLRSHGLPPGTLGSVPNPTGPVFLVDCPTRLAIQIVSGKWTVLVLHALSQRPRRHGELVDLLDGISRKVLTQTLRRLQDYRLVERRTDSPQHVEYRLTELGQTLVQPIEALTTWARDHGAAIIDLQDAPRVAASR